MKLKRYAPEGVRIPLRNPLNSKERSLGLHVKGGHGVCGGGAAGSGLRLEKAGSKFAMFALCKLAKMRSDHLNFAFRDALQHTCSCSQPSLSTPQKPRTPLPDRSATTHSHTSPKHKLTRPQGPSYDVKVKTLKKEMLFAIKSANTGLLSHNADAHPIFCCISSACQQIHISTASKQVERSGFLFQERAESIPRAHVSPTKPPSIGA